jgi:hypothetical protein
MATLTQKIEAEQRLLELLADNELPAPDEVEYGETCIRALWHDSKACVVVDIDEPPADAFDPADLGAPADPAEFEEPADAA